MRGRWTRGRGGGVHDRDVRLPGVDDRPVVRGPADRVHLPSHRQLRGGSHAMESDRAWARAAIMREACNREDASTAEGAGSTGRRTAARRSAAWTPARSSCTSATRGRARGVFPAAIAEIEARRLIEAEPPMAGQDLAAVVTPSEVRSHGTGDGPRITVIDTGIKASMVRELVQRGARVTLHPCTSSPAPTARGGPGCDLPGQLPATRGALLRR